MWACFSHTDKDVCMRSHTPGMVYVIYMSVCFKYKCMCALE